MILQKKEFPLPRIDLKRRWISRREGQIEWVVGLFWVLFLGILLCSLLQVKAYRAASLYIEDALAASNLAAAVIDIREYGVSHNLIIADAREAYERFRMAVKENLQLNEQWEGTNSALISGKVVIEKFVVYNVEGNTVKIYEVGPEGVLSEAEENVESCMVFHGIPVVSTGIYSEISFPMVGIWGLEVKVHKGKFVDIVAE